MNNCCSKEYGNVRTPVTDDYLDIYTASKEQQELLKSAWLCGMQIEAKGRDDLSTEYRWAVVSNPKWDFRNNYYRIKQ